MTVHERSIGGVAILDVDGRISVQEGATVFREALSRLLNAVPPKIVVNLAAVPYIDSTVLGELVRGYTSAARRGGALKLLQVPSSVQQLLVMTRLDGVFQAFEREVDAVKSFGPGSA